ncbi:universal stress protein [Georgenia sp. TF02-10]|uniref:universal stress protein n=1 Tax=Georgenia sp. TF02-10 TaxID=2917725 RepID=UPI001FA7FED9|nr:universal stress protein [Georgenia sp. TF02-10]UNX53399.1 universal stress protein [Georgenia sp. TF02-10]
MSVVVGYLGTNEGEAALDAAVEEARRRGTRLVVVLSARPGEDDTTLDAQADALRDRLDAADLAYEVRLRRGKDVAEELLGVVTETSADLLVIGLRRRSPVGKLILGSNAQRILLDAACPVLAVKPVQS